LDIGAKHWERHSWNSDLMCLLLEGAENYIPIDTIIISQWKIMNEAQTILRQGIIITFAALLVSPGKAKATTSLFFFFFSVLVFGFRAYTLSHFTSSFL
jgi:hypothetical protein